MPTNVTPQFQKAEQEYLQAETTEQKIHALKKMIALAPGHKGAENLRADLKRRLARLKYAQEKETKKKKSGRKEGIKKTGDALVALVGMANSGKSSLLAALTNASPKISPFPYTTSKPEQGVFDYGGCRIQIVDLPSLHGDAEIDSEQLGIMRTADLIAIIAVSDDEINKIMEELKATRTNTMTLVIHNKTDIIPKVPIKSEMSVSALTKQNIPELKEKIFSKLNLIRIFTKEPGKKKAELPVILKQNSTIRDFAEKIHKSFLEKFNYALVWGPSVKFQGQRCSLEHKLKDGDIVEIYLKK